MTLRKNNFFLALAMLFLTAFSVQAQTYTLTISGTVTEQGTGNPVPNHQVYIQLDSSGGFPYFNTVTTNAAGAYSDVIQVPFFAGTGAGEVYTVDCQQFIHQVPFQYSPNLNNISANFTICTSVSSNCQAGFSWNPTPLGAIAFSDQSIAPSDSITTWFWDFGDGSSSTQQNPNHTYNSPGPFVVCLTIGTALGCQSIYCDTVTTSTGGGCQAAFSYSQQGSNFAFTDQSTSSSPVNWFWDFGDGSNSGLQNPTHTYANPGTYIVCLTIFDSLQICNSTYCDTINVQGSGNCQAGFSYFTNGPTIILSDQSTSSAGPITSWFWTFGDGSTSTSQNPAHTYNAGGAYTVCLTIGTSQGCQSTFCDSVFIQTGSGGCWASFGFSATPAGPIAFSDSSFSTNGTINSWFWDFGDGNTSTQQNPTHVYSNPGTYNVCLTIGTTNGCQSTICNIVTVGGGGGCQAAFSWTTGGLFNTVLFTDQSVFNSPVNWFWDFGDGATSTQQNPTHTYSQPGTYIACLTISDSIQSCVSTTCDTIVIQGGGNPTCQAAFNWTYNGNAVVFADQSTSSPGQIIGWTWDFGDGTTSNNSNPTHTYANGGLYTVCLTIFTSDSCSSTVCNQVQAAGGGPQCSADFTWSYNGTSVVFADISTASPGNVNSWSWDFGDGNGSSQQNPTHTYAQGGLYTVCLTIGTTDSCSSTICYTLQANGGGALCQASFISYPDTTGQFSTIIVNTSTGSGLGYFWDFGDGGTSTSATPTHQYNGPGTYLVCLTISNPTCVSTFCDSVTVSSPQNSIMVQSAVMGIGQQLQQIKLNVDIYPNPARDAAKVRVDLPQGGEATMELVDLQGRVVSQIANEYLGTGVNVIDLDLNGLSQGLYFFNLRVGEYSAVSKLMVNPSK